MAVSKLIKIENIEYILLIKTQETENSCAQTTVSITDMKCIWQAKLNAKEIVDLLKNNNPSIQWSDNGISEYITKLINDNNAEVKYTKLNDEEIKITIFSDTAAQIDFTLKKQSNEVLFKEITLPILMEINELNYRTEELIKIVKSKDVEIKEFKFEGASITRKNAITEPFDAENFNDKCRTNLQSRVKELISKPCSSIYSSLTSDYGDFSSILANVEKEELITKPTKEDAICTNTIQKETDPELKRKISEALFRTKRPKKRKILDKL